MHVPDGFLDAPTSVATAAVAVVAVAGALRGARRELDDRTAPLAGLVAVFVFAAQMINFPVGAGTSGHLMGGVLAAVLVGPWTATLALTVVLLVQALFFADGGLTALGTNVTLIAVVAVWVGYGVFRLIQWLRPTSRAIIPVAAGIAALVSVPVAALVFAGLWAVGGAAPIDLGLLTTTMVGWHTVIGVGDSSPRWRFGDLAARPDIVCGLPTAPAELTVRSGVEVTMTASTTEQPQSRQRLGGAARSSSSGRSSASSPPVVCRTSPPSTRTGRARGQVSSTTPRDSAVADSPLADYGTAGVERGCRPRSPGGRPAHHRWAFALMRLLARRADPAD